MFRPKTPKSQLPDKTPYTAYNPHTIPLSERNWSQDYYRILSIDPGIKNFGIRIEDRPRLKSNSLITTKLFQRLTLSSLSPSLSSDSIINNDNLSFIYDIITNFLDQHLDLIKSCHFIIFERQLPINYRTVRVSQHLLSYFLLHLKNSPLLPIILEIDPKLKSKQLGAPSGLNDKQIKDWSVEKALYLLELRKDSFAIDIINKERNHRGKKKPDDLADTVCQIEALFSYLNLPLTEPITTIKLSIPHTPSPSNSDISSFLNSHPTNSDQKSHLLSILSPDQLSSLSQLTIIDPIIPTYTPNNSKVVLKIKS